MKSPKVSALAAILLSVFAFSAPAAHAPPLRLGTGGKGGVYFAWGEVLRNLVAAQSNDAPRLAVQATAGSAANMRLLASDLVQLAIEQDDVFHDAIAGKGSFSQGGPVSGVRVLTGLFTEACQIVVDAAGPLRSVGDLAGKRVSVGEPDSGAFAHAVRILASYGLSLDGIEPVYLSYADAAKALERGEIDAFFCTAGVPTPAISALAAKKRVRLLPLDERAQEVLLAPGTRFRKMEIPAGVYAGVSSPVPTLGILALLVARADVGAADVGRILSAVYDNPGKLPHIFGPAEKPSPADVAGPFHAGAVAWFASRGISVSAAGEIPPPAAERARRRIAFDMFQTLAIAVLALFLGETLKKKIKFLRTFCIPSPVVGGLLFACASCALYVTKTVEFAFDETFRTICMVLFFTSVGFQANLKVLKSGGKGLAGFLAVVCLLIFLQNGVAVALAKPLGVSPLIGLCTGSIAMVGGHGTAGAFGPLLEDMNVTGATTLATAAATFGLVAGSLMGGPLATRLIVKRNLLSTVQPEDDSLLVEDRQKHRRTVSMYAPAAYQLVLAAGIGTVVSLLLSKTGMTFPVYIGAMLSAAAMRNIGEATGAWHVHMGEIGDLGEISLSLFLGVAMITLKLWQLAALALPLVAMLGTQTVLMYLFARWVVFNAMGRDYDAAVLAAGTCGFGMGATPNAMANMQAVTEKYAPSVKAYLLVPIVGSMFADFVNSLAITFFLNWAG
jgi:sodium--glutamate symport carrier gltS